MSEMHQKIISTNRSDSDFPKKLGSNVIDLMPKIIERKQRESSTNNPLQSIEDCFNKSNTIIEHPKELYEIIKATFGRQTIDHLAIGNMGSNGWKYEKNSSENSEYTQTTFFRKPIGKQIDVMQVRIFTNIDPRVDVTYHQSVAFVYHLTVGQNGKIFNQPLQNDLPIFTEALGGLTADIQEMYYDHNPDRVS